MKRKEAFGGTPNAATETVALPGRGTTERGLDGAGGGWLIFGHVVTAMSWHRLKAMREILANNRL